MFSVIIHMFSIKYGRIHIMKPRHKIKKHKINE